MKAARWAASWTESVKTRVFFSSSGRWVEPKAWDRATDRRVEAAVPMKRTASRVPQAGQVSRLASSPVRGWWTGMKRWWASESGSGRRRAGPEGSRR